MDLTTLCHVEGEKLADWFPSALCNVVLDEWPISDFFPGTAGQRFSAEKQ